MDKQAEVGAFLTSRRARITPEQAGLPSYGKRRVPGLRRGEVAQPAGMSVENYTRLERGNLSGVSESVLGGSCTRRWASWHSPTKRWTCPATTSCPSPSTAPKTPQPPTH